MGQKYKKNNEKTEIEKKFNNYFDAYREAQLQRLNAAAKQITIKEQTLFLSLMFSKLSDFAQEPIALNYVHAHECGYRSYIDIDRSLNNLYNSELIEAYWSDAAGQWSVCLTRIYVIGVHDDRLWFVDESPNYMLN